MASKSIAIDRIHKLLDEGSFIETQSFIAPSVITGFGQINGRLTYIFSEDKNAGAFDSLHAEKIKRLYDSCFKVGAPIIGIYDSKGADLNGGIETLDGFGSVFSSMSKLSGVVPQISIIVSDLVGSETICPMLSDFIFAVKGKSISMNSKSITNVKPSDTSVQFVENDEDKCFTDAKKLLEFLPQNYLEKVEDIDIIDDLNRKIEVSDDIDTFIKTLVDNGEYLEVEKESANGAKTYFARLGSMAVGIVANDKKVDEGRIDSASATKIAKFVSKCDSFNVPVLTIINTKGYKINDSNLPCDVSKLAYAYSIATVPMVTLISGDAIGNAYVSMGSKHLGIDMVYAYADSNVGILTKEAAEAIYGDKDKNSDIKKVSKGGFVDAIIEKADTRQILISAFDSLATKYVATIGKKHSNIL